MDFSVLHRLRRTSLTDALRNLMVGTLVAFGSITIAGAACGDGVVDGTEDCDGADLQGMTCVALGYTGGTLACSPACVFDTSACTAAICGNGVVEPPGEECDEGPANGTPGSFCSLSCTFSECWTDNDCNNFYACDGVETCDTMMGRCIPGAPVQCNDGDPCTYDFCEPDTGACNNTPSGDLETAGGVDGRCNTLDDNLDLFGPDRACGTGDDQTGDGVCTALDNCPFAWNPSQADSDTDRSGDACDSSVCRTFTAYVTDFDRLLRVDVASGAVVQEYQGIGADLADVEVNAGETQAYMAVRQFGMVLGVDLASGMLYDVASGGMADPWGITLPPDEFALYVTDFATGEVFRADLSGGGFPNLVVTGLNGPRGIAADPSGTAAYVAEYASGTLSEIQLFAGPAQIPTPRASGLSGPTGVALNAAGSIAYVTETDTGELSRVDLATGAVSLVAGGLAGPLDVELDGAEATAYVAEQSGRLTAVDLVTGGLSTISMGLMRPTGIDLGNPGPIVMSLPEDVIGAPGAGLSIPVGVTDVTGQGVLSADFTVEFNPNVLSATGVAPGALAAGCTTTANLSLPGRAVVSVFCTSDRSGSGSIADISFDVGGTPGNSTPLRLTQGMLNEGVPAVCLDSGSFAVPVEISGRISYYRDHITDTEPSAKRVAGVLLDLSNQPDPGIPEPPIATTASGCGGDYSFPDLLSGRSYFLTPGKANDFGAAIDPFDASLNAQHVVGLISLTPGQRLAADVTGNGSLSSLDSARIAQFSVGLISRFPVALLNGDWAFVPVPQAEPYASPIYPFPPGGLRGHVQYTPIVESAENQDFLGVLFGDVSGNWQPPVCSPASGMIQPLDAAASEAASVSASGGGTLAMPTLTASPGQIIRVPITGTGVAEAVSFYLDVRYNPKVLRLVQASSGAATAGFSTTTNTQEAGRGRLALFRATPLGADGEVAALTFEVIGKPGSRSWLRLPAYTVNEGEIAVGADDGLVKVERRTRTRP